SKDSPVRPRSRRSPARRRPGRGRRSSQRPCVASCREDTNAEWGPSEISAPSKSPSAAVLDADDLELLVDIHGHEASIGALNVRLVRRVPVRVVLDPLDRAAGDLGQMSERRRTASPGRRRRAVDRRRRRARAALRGLRGRRGSDRPRCTRSRRSAGAGARGSRLDAARHRGGGGRPGPPRGRVPGMWRATGGALPGDVPRFPALVLDERRHEVFRADKKVELTATEFGLLRYFMLNPRLVLSKPQILQNVWRYDFGGNSNVVEA